MVLYCRSELSLTEMVHEFWKLQYTIFFCKSFWIGFNLILIKHLLDLLQQSSISTKLQHVINVLNQKCFDLS